MQITETLSEGLKRGFKIVVPAGDLESRVAAELEELKGKVKINGFRPGKAPMSFLRKIYGRSVMADVIQNTVNEANRAITEDRGLKLAQEPKVTFPEAQDEIAAVMDGKADLAFDVSVEVLPSFEVGDYSDVALVRDVVELDDATVDEALARMAKQNRTFTPRPDDAAAEMEDRVTIDFAGSIDGVAFEGGTGEDVPVDIGSGTFIPGFEDGLIGARAGESRVIEALFPTGYSRKELAGKAATFQVTVKSVAAPDPVVIDDALAKGFGMETLAQLREAVSASIARDFAERSRVKLKRKLLDALDAKYDFDLPPTLVEQEFAGIWAQIEREMAEEKRSFADEGETEEAARADYRRIAERRVRLGLVLAEIGARAGVQVSDDEMSQALVARARQFPGQEKAVWEFYRKNPQAMAELRAPLFEDKVVDVVLAGARVEDRVVSKEALFAEDEVEPSKA